MGGAGLGPSPCLAPVPRDPEFGELTAGQTLGPREAQGEGSSAWELTPQLAVQGRPKAPDGLQEPLSATAPGQHPSPERSSLH